MPLTLQNTSIQNYVIGSFHVNDSMPMVNVLLSKYKCKNTYKKIKRKLIGEGNKDKWKLSIQSDV